MLGFITHLHWSNLWLSVMTFVLQDDQSPLYVASSNGHLDVVKALIEFGANISHCDKVGKYTYTYLYSIHAPNVHAYN